MKKTLLFLVIVLIAIQFYRPYKTVPSSSKKDFLVLENAPAKIVKIFQKSCYDCHSNNTNYKWYDKVAPLSWYVDAKIKRGKFSLNFSEWGDFEPWRRRLFLQGAIMYDIKTKKMPPRNYLWLHNEAKILKSEEEEIEVWINTLDFFKD